MEAMQILLPTVEVIQARMTSPGLCKVGFAKRALRRLNQEKQGNGSQHDDFCVQDKQIRMQYIINRAKAQI